MRNETIGKRDCLIIIIVLRRFCFVFSQFSIQCISESTDIDKVHCNGVVLGAGEIGIFNGTSSIFSRSAAPAEFCLNNLGLI